MPKHTLPKQTNQKRAKTMLCNQKQSFNKCPLSLKIWKIFNFTAFHYTPIKVKGTNQKWWIKCGVYSHAADILMQHIHLKQDLFSHVIGLWQTCDAGCDQLLTQQQLDTNTCDLWRKMQVNNKGWISMGLSAQSTIGTSSYTIFKLRQLVGCPEIINSKS